MYSGDSATGATKMIFLHFDNVADCVVLKISYTKYRNSVIMTLF